MDQQNSHVTEKTEEAGSASKKKNSGLATAGLVLGIIGVCLSFVLIINNAAFILGVLAVVFGGVALKKHASRGKAVAALVLGLLAIVFTLIAQSAVSDAIDDLTDDLNYMTGEKTEDVLREYLDVQFGTFRVVQGEFTTDTSLSVTLKNKGSKKQSFDVTVEAVDKDGGRIDTDIIYVSDLGAGQTQTVEVFDFVIDDRIAALKNATFRVVSASMY